MLTSKTRKYDTEVQTEPFFANSVEQPSEELLQSKNENEIPRQKSMAQDLRTSSKEMMQENFRSEIDKNSKSATSTLIKLPVVRNDFTREREITDSEEDHFISMKQLRRVIFLLALNYFFHVK